MRNLTGRLAVLWAAGAVVAASAAFGAEGGAGSDDATARAPAPPAEAAAKPAEPGWLAGWPLRRKVTVRQGFFVLGEHLKEVPVLIALDAEAAPDLFADAARGRTALALTAADGTTRLPHEVEVFVAKEPPTPKEEAETAPDGGGEEGRGRDARDAKSARRLRCYVRVPKLLADADTDLYLYYGLRPRRGGRPNTPKPAEVWTNAFRAVYHFNAPKLTGTKDEVQDATKHANHAQPEEMAVTAVGGVVGRALDGLATAEDDRSLDLAQLDGWTVETWVRWPKKPADAHVDVVRKDGWRLYWHAIGRWQALISDDPKSRGNVLYAYKPDPQAGGRWRYLAAVYQAKTRKLDLYMDGVVVHTRTIEKMGDFGGRRSLVLGVPAERDLRVLVDEVRISGVARSADWLAVTHKNLAFPHKRIRIGPCEQRAEK